MLPIKSLITLDQIQEHASRSNFRYGQKISEDADINFTKINTFNILANVKQKNKEYSVELQSTTKGFRWKCTCSSKKDFFCEHCTAVALYWNNQNQING